MTDNRTQTGIALAKEIAGVELSPDGGTPMAVAARDIVFGEIWGRPGLDKRSRLWITLTCVLATGAPTPVQIYARAAVSSGLVTMEELREFVLHFAMYQGFPKATVMDAALNEVEASLKAGKA